MCATVVVKTDLLHLLVSDLYSLSVTIYKIKYIGSDNTRQAKDARVPALDHFRQILRIA